jgi:alpha-glucan phosphorylase-like protein
MEQGTIDTAAAHIRDVSDATLWQLRNTARQDLVRYAREQFARQLAIAAAPMAEVEQAQQLFDPKVLTLGFARRFATYKRPGLLLHDPERLLRILTNPERPMQLIVAGKAHPQDCAGQAMVQDWVRISQRPEARRHVMFLRDYDMLLASHLVQGVDVWINNPRRPWEASGTSGMKVLVNGGLDPNAVQVELYAESPNGAAPLRLVMTRGERLTDAKGYVYSARVPASNPATDYTPRIIPNHPEAAVPLEAAQILWRR